MRSAAACLVTLLFIACRLNHAMVDYGRCCVGPSGTRKGAVACFVLGLLAGSHTNLAKNKMGTLVNDFA